MLKQEEALWELDRSIDNFAEKLDRADNRRLRVMGRLLEHVAAAANLPDLRKKASSNENIRLELKEREVKTSGIQDIHDIAPPAPAFTAAARPHTPPRSPKLLTHSSSPPALSKRINPIHPETRASTQSSLRSIGRMSAETVRIYVEQDVVGHDVYGLLADVEAEMERMSTVKELRDAEIPLEKLEKVSYVPYRAPKSSNR